MQRKYQAAVVFIIRWVSSPLGWSKFREPLPMLLHICLGKTALNLPQGFFRIINCNRIIWNLILRHVLNLISSLACYISPHAIQRSISANISQIIFTVSLRSASNFINICISGHLYNNNVNQCVLSMESNGLAWLRLLFTGKLCNNNTRWQNKGMEANPKTTWALHKSKILLLEIKLHISWIKW